MSEENFTKEEVDDAINIIVNMFTSDFVNFIFKHALAC